jgi:hypothetical protein
MLSAALSVKVIKLEKKVTHLEQVPIDWNMA